MTEDLYKDIRTNDLRKILKNYIDVFDQEAKNNFYIVKRELTIEVNKCKEKDNVWFFDIPCEQKLTTEIISGPAKGTKIITLFEKNNSGSRVSFQLDLKLDFKAKILRPIITKYYNG